MPKPWQLWRRAEQRLRLLDTEPPVAIDQVDALLQVLGPRRPRRGARRLAAALARAAGRRGRAAVGRDHPVQPDVQRQAPALHAGRRDRAPGRRQRRQRDRPAEPRARDRRRPLPPQGHERGRPGGDRDPGARPRRRRVRRPHASAWRRRRGARRAGRACSSSTTTATAGSACPTRPSCASPCSSPVIGVVEDV